MLSADTLAPEHRRVFPERNREGRKKLAPTHFLSADGCPFRLIPRRPAAEKNTMDTGYLP